MERRGSPRIELSLLCRVAGAGRHAPPSSGFTVNIGRSGALVCIWNEGSPEMPRLGEMLDVEVELARHTALPQRCMVGRASVQRVSWAHSGGYLVALKFHKLQFDSRAANPDSSAEWATARRKPMLM